MLVKLRGNIGDEVTYHTEDGDMAESQIVHVDISVFENHYEAFYDLKNGRKISYRSVVNIQHRPVKDIEVLDTVD